MSRNWGIMSGRPALGGTSDRPSAAGADTHAELDNIISLASRLPPGTVWPNSRSQEVEPFICPYELGSHFLFLALLLLPIAIVGGVAIGYLAVVPELVEYQSSVEAYRFKGH